MVQLIERKKWGGALTPEELEWICSGYLAGEIPEYQVAAWLMAVRWRGMTEAETLGFTRAMVASGETLEWPADWPVVDKHSTGGVGDKTSIALVPLLAAAGMTFVKMSGRGLGHTGGTIDKLESIPGFETDLTLDRLRGQVGRIGCALVGQSRDLVPADGALYALRGVTATVDSVPLIASSVMSKKLAAGARGIVLDVKYGTGAFMGSEAEAEALATAMIHIGTGAGRRVRAVLSPMHEPLGRAVGNALEVAEAIEILRGGGPEDLRELTLVLGSQLMVVGGAGSDPADARRALETLLRSGVAAEKFEQLVREQGGDAGVVRDTGRLPRAGRVVPLRSPRAGWVESVDARAVAEAALDLGAGRRRKGDPIDPAAGIVLLVKGGRRVEQDEPLADLHVGGAGPGGAMNHLLDAFRWSEGPTPTAVSRHRVLGE
ncbi:MAG: thymidine phosphorylase [Gemmatimonadota bacterium]